MPDDKRSQAHISGPNQIGMESVAAALADEKQALVGAIAGADGAAFGAGLAGVVRVHFHTERAGQHRLVVQEAA